MKNSAADLSPPLASSGSASSAQHSETKTRQSCGAKIWETQRKNEQAKKDEKTKEDMKRKNEQAKKNKKAEKNAERAKKRRLAVASSPSPLDKTSPSSISNPSKADRSSSALDEMSSSCDSNPCKADRLQSSAEDTSAGVCFPPKGTALATVEESLSLTRLHPLDNTPPPLPCDPQVLAPTASSQEVPAGDQSTSLESHINGISTHEKDPFDISSEVLSATFNSESRRSSKRSMQCEGLSNVRASSTSQGSSKKERFAVFRKHQDVKVDCTSQTKNDGDGYRNGRIQSINADRTQVRLTFGDTNEIEENVEMCRIQKLEVPSFHGVRLGTTIRKEFQVGAKKQFFTGKIVNYGKGGTNWFSVVYDDGELFCLELNIFFPQHIHAHFALRLWQRYASVLSLPDILMISIFVFL